jgi:hypothetical protein
MWHTNIGMLKIPVIYLDHFFKSFSDTCKVAYCVQGSILLFNHFEALIHVIEVKDRTDVI